MIALDHPRPLRFSGLGFMKTGPALWRFIDLEQSAYNNRDRDPAWHCYSAIGPFYRTKAELLADANRYAESNGHTADPQ